MNAIIRTERKPETLCSFATANRLQGAIFIPYHGDTMKPTYRPGSLLAVLPEKFTGQALRYCDAYAIVTRSQGLIFGRYCGTCVDQGESCLVISRDNPEYKPDVKIPVSDVSEVGRVLAVISEG